MIRQGLAALLFAALAAACASPVASPGPTALPQPTSPVEGVVVGVDAQGLTEVRSFTLRTAAGTELPFVVGELENAVEFPPSHLAAHLADAFPVRVFFREEGGQLVAYRLEDATPPSS